MADNKAKTSEVVGGGYDDDDVPSVFFRMGNAVFPQNEIAFFS